MKNNFEFYLQKIDWALLEIDVLSCVEKAIDVILKLDLKDVFSFVLDVNLTYGDMYIAVGTNSDIDSSVLQYAEDSSSIFSQSTENDIWSVGDWKYPSINDYFSEYFEEKWRSWGDLVASVYYKEVCDTEDDDELEKQFYSAVLEKLIHILIRFKDKGIFESIEKSPFFDVLVIEHDETIGDAIERNKRANNH